MHTFISRIFFFFHVCGCSHYFSPWYSYFHGDFLVMLTCCIFANFCFCLYIKIVCQKVTSHPLFTVYLMNDEIVFFLLVFFNVKLKVAHY